MGNGGSNFSYLDMLAEIGYARHIGGKGATDRLIQKANIKKGSKVLDVGCGLGKTSCRLAAELGCTVTGIDIMPKMIVQAMGTAKKAGVGDKVTFMEGDARKLPFEDNSFDTVLVESVTIFVEDVTRAIAEYNRVVKPGGAVLDNEVCITRAVDGSAEGRHQRPGSDLHRFLVEYRPRHTDLRRLARPLPGPVQKCGRRPFHR